MGDQPPEIVSKSSPAQAATTNTTSTGEIEQAPQETSQDFSELIVACQAGDFQRVKDLITSGEATAMDEHEDGTSPLHWAAINNRLTVCKFLLESGASVDAKGGHLQATPLHWASRSGLVYIAHLLIQNGADPLRTDQQGFNALHLAVHSSNVLLVIYLLHQGVPVDFTEPASRTVLHWAAYQGDALSVDALLNWGADVKLKDKEGFTPLHWAMVRGNVTAMKRLIEEGADIHAQTNDGKTPAKMAQEMHTVAQWQQALNQAGRLPNGAPKPRSRLTKQQVDLIMFFVPFLLLAAIVLTIATFQWYLVLPLIPVEIFITLRLCKAFVLTQVYSGNHLLMQSPFLSGVFAGSCFWTLVRYVLYILPVTLYDAPILNLAFVLLFGTVLYSFFRAMLMDPGYIPKLSGITEQREVIEDLIERGEYDTKHFCIVTYVRKPLRSKYDKQTKKVVARFDHYCPWVNNVIGVRNHRMFVVYVLSVMVGLPILDWLYFGTYAELIGAGVAESSSCEIYPDALCKALSADSFTSQFVIWDSLQLSWVVILAFVQLVQIGRALTTSEASNLHRFGSVGVEDFSSLPADHQVNHDKANADASGSGRVESVAFAHHNKKKWYSSLLKLLGIDQFISTAQDLSNSSRRHSNRRNPADYGLRRNCMDFWFPHGDYNILHVYEDGKGALNGQDVDYYSLYDYPVKTTTANGNNRHAYEMVEQV